MAIEGFGFRFFIYSNDDLCFFPDGTINSLKHGILDHYSSNQVA